MAKPLSVRSEGFADGSFKTIIPQTPYLNQLFLSIRRRRLTEVLEALERRGLTGDVAIFALACLQRGER